METYLNSIKLLCIVLLCAITIPCFGQNRNVKISGFYHYKVKKVPDSALSQRNKSDDDPWGDVFYKHVKIDSNQFFEIKFSDILKSTPVTVGAFYKQRYDNKFAREFLVEPGDEITLDIYDKFDNTGKVSDSLVISGFGSSKYVLVDKIRKLYEPLWDARNEIFGDSSKSSDEFAGKLDRFLKLLLEYKYQREKLIDSSDVNPEMKKLVKYEVCPPLLQLGVLMIFYQAPEYGKFRNQIAKFFNTNVQRFLMEKSDLMTQSPTYIRAISYNILYELIFSGEGRNDKPLIGDYLNWISKHYSSSIQERLVFEIYTNPLFLADVNLGAKSHTDSALAHASSMVNKPMYKNMLKNLQTGSKMFRFDFKDTKNEMFSLESLKGKVILVDVWFTGCEGCAVFHQWSKKNLMPFIKENSKDIVYVSLNADKNETQWLKSIKTGIYTNEEEININTGPQGFSSSFFTHYNIMGGPTFLIFDKGGLLYDKQTAGGMYKLQDILKNAVLASK